MSLRDSVHRRIPESWIRAWPTVRAILVTYHVLAVLVLSFPSPPANLNRGAWENPTVQNEFRLWAERLRSVGVSTTPAELDKDLYALAKRYLAARDKVITPFEPYSTYAGVRESWRMFVGPQRYPVRIEISVREGGQWRKVYESRAAPGAWREATFERYRMRRVVYATAWDNPRQFKQLCDWIAVQAGRDFPGATEVMIRHLRYRTPTPAEALEGKSTLESKYVARETRKLGAGAPGPARETP